MRIIPENNLACPVLVVLDNGGSGSGFLLTTSNTTYFITAKHVLFDIDDNLLASTAELICQTEAIDDDSTYVFSINLRTLNSAKHIISSPTADITVLKISDTIYTDKTHLTHSMIDGVVEKQVGNGNIVSVISNDVLLFKDVLISNDVFVYGYPSTLGLRESPQFDYNKPLLRKGVIANVNKSSGTIILDCPVYYGNSGGPVFQVNIVNGAHKHHLIGVVSEFIPFEEDWVNTKNGITHKEWSNSGYSVAVSMDFVFSMLGI